MTKFLEVHVMSGDTREPWLLRVSDIAYVDTYTNPDGTATRLAVDNAFMDRRIMIQVCETYEEIRDLLYRVTQ